MKRKIYLLLLPVIVIACHSPSKIASTSSSGPGLVVNGKVFTSAYQQTAAEYKALCYQAFNLARYRVDQFRPSGNLPPAIITDVDETILDNSPYAVNRARTGHDYDQPSWYEWTALASAPAVPGAAGFLTYASSKGIEIFYITNRDLRERDATITNLRRLGLPNADTFHVLTRKGSSAKEPRRQQVLKNHELVLLLGDNLPDFSNAFDKKGMKERNQVADINDDEFGRKFIIIPNPVYGDWEGSIYQYNYKLTPQQKDSALHSVLQGY